MRHETSRQTKPDDVDANDVEWWERGDVDSLVVGLKPSSPLGLACLGYSPHVW